MNLALYPAVLTCWTYSNIAKRVLSKPDISNIPAVQWGISKEDTAKRDYIREMSSHNEFEDTAAGLVVNTLFTHCEASPDGFVDCSCCGKGLVEIKCPFTAKDLHPDAIREEQHLCLAVKDMSTSQSYCTQIQSQLVISERHYCHLAVWTNKGIAIERVYQDVNFTEKLTRKLTTLYVDYIIPQLVPVEMPSQAGVPNKAHTIDPPTLYCFCQKEESSNMIMCENPHCQYTIVYMVSL